MNHRIWVRDACSVFVWPVSWGFWCISRFQSRNLWFKPSLGKLQGLKEIPSSSTMTQTTCDARLELRNKVGNRITDFRLPSSGVPTGLDGSDGDCDLLSWKSLEDFFWNCCDNFRPKPATNPTQNFNLKYILRLTQAHVLKLTTDTKPLQDAALSNPPKVSALFGNIGDTYALLWRSPTELALRDKFVPIAYNELVKLFTFCKLIQNTD